MKRFYAAEEEEQADHRSCKVARQQKHAECSSYTAPPLAPAFPMIRYQVLLVPRRCSLLTCKAPSNTSSAAAYKETWLSITGQHEKALLLEKPLQYTPRKAISELGIMHVPSPSVRMMKDLKL
ncbi:hypothetical protein GOP47_0014364 [Adiantum capillus-veneris]|uniref:Uncharacterized protein n=1 Tax=Adiantum capillus-veneris TaxID=13818 RepID=A0A9D4UM58_ADICA|nr:hypothetical protein GOP47_0014364 [Adiantum capillus-veneris]